SRATGIERAFRRVELVPPRTGRFEATNGFGRPDLCFAPLPVCLRSLIAFDLGLSFGRRLSAMTTDKPGRQSEDCDNADDPSRQHDRSSNPGSALQECEPPRAA